MKATSFRWLILSLTIALFASSLPSTSLHAATWDPAAADYSGHKGKTIYVSKLGDNTDGSSWQKAFRTIQAALLAVPDDKGGHRIIIRPDTYVEANLYVKHKGAMGAYNLIAGDFDGKLGSGATGWVIVDCSAPGVAARLDPTHGGAWKIIKSDLPESGFKSVDWWCNFSGPPGNIFSNFDYDRWIFRYIYGTGGEGAFGPYTVGEECKAPCTMVVEDCVGIGRFAGAVLAGGVGRKGEPLQFRRCYFANLDWVGDAGAVYVRAHHTSMPDYPDAVFDDCTIISPDNALQSGYPGVDNDVYTYVRFKNCRLIVLNFTQPEMGGLSTGIIRCDAKDGTRLHVDFEDTILMGYKIFGTRQGEVSYTTKGKVQAYVQFKQPMPKGFERLGLWPVDLYDHIAPPKNIGNNKSAK